VLLSTLIVRGGADVGSSAGYSGEEVNSRLIAAYRVIFARSPVSAAGAR
jgi:hypothetical protein